MKLTLTFLSLFVFSMMSFGQDGFVLSKKNRKQVVLNDSVLLTVKTVDKINHIGNAIIVNDSSFKIDQDTIGLNEVKTIYIKNKKTIYGGSALTVVGLIYTAASGYLIVTGFQTGNISQFFAVVSIPAFIATSYVLYKGIQRIVKGRIYKLPKWDLDIEVSHSGLTLNNHDCKHMATNVNNHNPQGVEA